MKRFRNWIIAGVVGIVATCICLSVVVALNPSTATATPGSVAQAEPTQPDAINPTNTAPPSATSPSATPRPSNTPRPTSTPRPTETASPTQAPIVYSGNGDSVVEVDKPDGVMLMRVEHTGPRDNFIIYSFGSGNVKQALLVNVIGDYTGTVLLDIRDDEQTERFTVEGSGDWTITLLPLSAVRVETIPGKIEGTGDDVIALRGGTPDVVAVVGANTDSSNFIIHGWTTTGRELMVNEITPYAGQVLAPAGLVLIEVNAEGAWVLTFQ